MNDKRPRSHVNTSQKRSDRGRSRLVASLERLLNESLLNYGYAPIKCHIGSLSDKDASYRSGVLTFDEKFLSTTSREELRAVARRLIDPIGAVQVRARRDEYTCDQDTSIQREVI